METKVTESQSAEEAKQSGSSQKLLAKEIDKNILNQEISPVGSQTRKVSLRVDYPVGTRHQKNGRTANVTADQTTGYKLTGDFSGHSRNARRRSTFKEAAIQVQGILQRHRRTSHTRRRSLKTKVSQIAKMHKRTPREIFQRAVRMVVVLTRAFHSIVRFAMEKGGHGEITDEATLSLRSTAGVRGVCEKLLFDPAVYKCQYQVMLPQWAKRLTSKEPSRRKEKDIWSLVHLMKQLKGFRRYSFEMQYAICKAIRYDCYGRRRVVIRKGHVAQRFYFIFSGSVCVTFDEDDYAAFNQPEDNDKSVLKKGDHFGELAFIRNLNRAATIVCLEETELLSVNKEDFFMSGIDKSFRKGMDNRVNFLCSRPILSSWPEQTVRNIAQESKLQDYHSDEVIVRDSTTSAWLVFIVKGQADVLRLLDLSNCEEYTEHCHKYRRRAIEAAGQRSISPSNRISPSSITSFGVSLSQQTSNSKVTNSFISPIASEGQIFLKQREASYDVNEHIRLKSATPALKQKLKTIPKILSISKKGHVTFANRTPHGRNSNCDSAKSGASTEPQVEDSGSEKTLDSETPELFPRKSEPDVTGVGVYMRIDRLGPGDCFGLWSLGDFEKKKRKERCFHLLSLGCEVIKVSKDMVYRHSDELTMKKLKRYVKDYPSDTRLCHTYLKLSDWKTYREELVDNLVVNHLAKLETAKGSARAHLVKASPVPPPLCSVKPWQPVNEEWEYFPNVGWASVQVATPAIEGKNRVK